MTHQRVAVSAFIARDRRVLLLKRAAHETYLPGYFDLPGGKVDLGEDPRVAVIREAREEAGLAGKVHGLYNVWHWISKYRGQTTQFVSIGFLVEVEPAAEVRPQRDFEDFIWAEEADLEGLLLTPELRADLRRGFAHLAR